MTEFVAPSSSPAETAAEAPSVETPRRRGGWLRIALLAVAMALIIRWSLFEPYNIPSGSMQPTLQPGDRIFVNKFRYGLRWPWNGVRFPFTGRDFWYADGRLTPGAKPHRWDIVVFRAADPAAEKPVLVKRVVGLPGEKIHLDEGKVYVNGVQVERPASMESVYYTSPTPGAGSAMKFGISDEDAYAVVPEGHYLVLGDYSAFSRDGRYFGWLPERNIVGRVSAVWWPPSRWKWPVN